MTSSDSKLLFKPSRPYFGSGPCAKPQAWTPQIFDHALLGRSHRSKEGLERINMCVDLMREVLEIPDDYKIALISGSATGATESLFWNLLGPRPVDVYAFDVFSQKWACDITEHLKISASTIYSSLTDLKKPDFSHDLVLTWNGSTSGVCFPYDLWQGQTREGLIVCDATSAAFSVPLPWALLDATSFSWQKGLGGEASQGVVVLSPAAIERLNTYSPPWPIPSFLRLTRDQKANLDLFKGLTSNTPSLMIIEDAIFSLNWAKQLGGLPILSQRTQTNYQLIQEWVHSTPWIDFLALDASFRSPTTVCLKFQNSAVDWPWITQFCQKLAAENVAYDIKNHAQASHPSLRLWAGPTIEAQDLKYLFPWLEWAYDRLEQEE